MLAALLQALAAPLLRLLTALGLYAKGRADARQKAKLDAAEGYRDTRERMDDAQIPDDDPAALRDWLRHRDPGSR